jgi:hypothetical protein
VRLEGVQRPVTEVLRRAGVPGLLRDLVPVVVEADGRVAGLAGVAPADAPPQAAWAAWCEPNGAARAGAPLTGQEGR